MGFDVSTKSTLFGAWTPGATTNAIVIVVGKSGWMDNNPKKEQYHYGILWPRFLFQDTVGIMMGLRGEVPVDAEERSKVPQNTIW